MNARIIICIAALVGSFGLYAQDYQLNGNLGVGTNPEMTLDVDGDTKLRGDADLDGSLRLSSEEHRESILDNLLILDEEKQVKPILGAEVFLKAAYNYPCFTDGQGLIQPVWQAFSGNQSQARMILCDEARLGLGLSSPLAKLHVNGNGIINQKLTIGDASLHNHALYVDGESSFEGNLEVQQRLDVTGASILDGFVGLGRNSAFDGETLSIEAIGPGTNGILVNVGNTNDGYGEYGLRVRAGHGNIKALNVTNYWQQGGALEDIFTVKGDGSITTKISSYANNIFQGFSQGEEVFRISPEGHVYSEKVIVQLTPFPDYVFEDDYELMSLSELKTFINENRHLPNMPTAKNVHEQGGDLGELNRLVVEKVEELTLYMIQLHEENQKLREELKLLQEQSDNGQK